MRWARPPAPDADAGVRAMVAALRWSGRPLAALLAGLCLTQAVAAERAAPLPEATSLIARMRAAAATLNYDGVVLYQRGTDVLTMRIVHRGTPGPESERIVTLDGPPREIVRDGRHVTCVYSDDQSVMVDKRGPRNPLAFGVDLTDAALLEHYQFETTHETRVVGRQAFGVEIRPLESTRYGYRLWIDQGNGMLLKSAVVGPSGRVLEQTRFTHVEFPETIDDGQLTPQYTDSEFAWFSYDAEASEPRPGVARARGESWDVTWLPTGFEMTDQAEEQLIDHDTRVSHRVYTDGLAMVSVFVEPVLGEVRTELGFASIGAINTFSRVAGGYKVTVVGELPRTTISRIATSVEARRIEGE